ncbi:MAG: hypothetical protein COA86_05485 [Kangiella sp.]|nr:MAG: hypothetical protein COA86_05485 [Kangiella sp.]
MIGTLKSIMILLLAIYLSSCSESNQLASDTKSDTNQFQFSLSFPAIVSTEPLDGRIILILAHNDKTEPRFQVNSGIEASEVLGINVDGLKPNETALINGGVFGFPVESLNNLPAGDYYVQAVFHKYDTFNLSSGHTVKLPMDQGEGQHWNRSPGNLFSTTKKIHINPELVENISIVMDQVIPPITESKDTKYIKHIKLKSKLLSKFWGRDIYLGAHVLLPEGFDEHPQSKYPLMIFHGHFPSDFGGFRETPPDENIECKYSKRFDIPCYNRFQQQEAYDFYKMWTGPDHPRMLIIEIQHATPYYDDSYAVNSESQGPWGDAITYELIPHIEKQFRGIGKGWSRFTYGGSTGGWEALAVQVKYPDEYNGAFAACPDPIDFRAYIQTNIYEDKNAYFNEGLLQNIDKPAHRNYLGEITTTTERENLLELALGDKSRSGQQWDIWEATYSPQGEDGYPKRLWDKKTGKIDKAVAEYWRENYDLRYIMESNWSTLGPKLEGKLYIYAGDMDNYYLNNAVYLTEDFLKQTKNPFYNGLVDYGDRDEHCWNGDHENGNGISRLRYNTMYLPIIMKRIQDSAPTDADLTSWRY